MTLAEQIAALEAAIRSGARSISYDGQTIVRMSREEMVATLREMKREAGTLTSASAVSYPEYGKGLE